MMAKTALADYLDGKALDYIEQSLGFLARLVFIYLLSIIDTFVCVSEKARARNWVCAVWGAASDI